MINKEPHCLELEVNWGDMDSLGHVNNSVYLRYIEEARVRWFSELLGDLINAQVGPVLANINIDFRQAIVWPEKICVLSTASWQGGKSMNMQHRIVAANNHQLLYAEATAVIVWVDFNIGKAVALPEKLISITEKHKNLT